MKFIFLFTDCHCHCVSCAKYSGLCVHSVNNYIESTCYLKINIEQSTCLHTCLKLEPHALYAFCLSVLFCLNKVYKLDLSEMYLSIVV